ncbi:MAG: hypothetical protein V1837_06970 [Candidatus Woesearchaeota archaeon]
MQVQCIKCKGRGFCGKEFCPVYAKAQAAFKVQRQVKEEFLSSSPAPFVGRVGYPFLNVGILSPPEREENAWEYDAPRHWAREGYSISRVIELRTSLVNSRFVSHIRAQDKLLEISREIGMASKPVELEIHLEDKPVFHTNYDASMAPMGPNAKLKKAEITSNPKIPREVEKATSDVDLKAQEALLYLHGKGHDENYLSKLLSVGTIGIKMQRKLVPTRWSITAVDDFLGKQAIKEIKQHEAYEHCLYQGDFMGNYYYALMFPEKWSYELFESYMPKASWNISTELQYSTDNENYAGRKSYAENCAGGYYAARLAITERLAELKKQSSVLCLRFITGEYAAPLGVWVCREATRKAMANKPIFFDERNTMLRYIRALAIRKFGCDIEKILNESKLLKEIKAQSKLSSFM